MTNTRTDLDGPAWAGIFTRSALAELPADITTATPPQVDEVIRTATFDQASNLRRIGPQIDALAKALGYRRDSERIDSGRNRETRFFWVDETGTEVQRSAIEPAAREMWNMPSDDYAGPIAIIDATRRTDAEIEAVIVRCETEYERRPWNRYFRVSNAGGHVHKTRACRTCYVDTSFDWPTALSGADAQGVVEAAGGLTCLECFPEVRGSILEGRPPQLEMFETREQTVTRKEREAEAKAKRDEKIAKGVTEDGSPLHVRVDRVGYDIKTERAAELRYMDWATRVAQLTRRASARPDLELAGEIEDYQAGADAMVEALAWKRGMTNTDLVASLADKLAKKIQRETY